MANIPDNMLIHLRGLVDTFTERGHEVRGHNNDVAIAWLEAAADLAEVLTIN